MREGRERESAVGAHPHAGGVPLAPQYTQGRAGEVRNSVAGLAKTTRLLGYQPIIDFEEGLRQTVAFYRTQGDARPRKRKRARAIVAVA